MIDVHSHLLPGIDDGSRTPTRSVEVLQLFANHGVTDVILTPHVSAGELGIDAEDALERRDVSVATLEDAAPGSRPTRHLGFEIMMDRPLPSEILSDRRFALAESRYYLVEFHLGVIADFALTILRDIAAAGCVPLVAHAERYEACSPHVVAAWRGVGAKVQVDATTLTRPTTRGWRARQLLRHGLADVIAADNHGDRGRLITNGVTFLRERGGEFQAGYLAERNPAAIIRDQAMTDVPPLSIKETLIQRLQRFKGELTR